MYVYIYIYIYIYMYTPTYICIHTQIHRLSAEVYLTGFSSTNSNLQTKPRL